MNSTYIQIFPILLIFQLFWLPHCFINYLNFLIVSFSHPSRKTLPVSLISGQFNIQNEKFPRKKALVLSYHVYGMMLRL